MRIRKTVLGQLVELELVKIKDYATYSVYQIYKIEKNKRRPIYQTTFTEAQIEEIARKGYITDDEDTVYETIEK